MSKLNPSDGGLATGLGLLEAGIPMTLLMDLASGPHSHELYLSEQGDVDWIPVQATTGPQAALAV